MEHGASPLATAASRTKPRPPGPAGSTAAPEAAAAGGPRERLPPQAPQHRAPIGCRRRHSPGLAAPPSRPTETGSAARTQRGACGHRRARPRRVQPFGVGKRRPWPRRLHPPAPKPPPPPARPGRADEGDGGTIPPPPRLYPSSCWFLLALILEPSANSSVPPLISVASSMAGRGR